MVSNQKMDLATVSKFPNPPTCRNFDFSLARTPRDKGFEAFRCYSGSSLGKMVGFKAARPLYKLKKWSGIRDLKLLRAILGHLCGRWSGLRPRDLSTS